MIKEIFAQKGSKTGQIGKRLRDALVWWRWVLTLEVSQMKMWRDDDCRPPCHMFVDAASTPPRCAAVLAVDGVFLYTDVEPPLRLMEWFRERADKQITSLVRICCLCFCLDLLCSQLRQEIVAILISLATFKSEVKGRKLVLFSDNSGAEKSTVKGSSRAFDHNMLIHEIWTHAVAHDIKLWIERVPSEFNISDSPSRFDYKLLQDIGATWRKPVLGAGLDHILMSGGPSGPACV